MTDVLTRVRSEMQRRGFLDYYPAMAVWPFAPGTNPPRGQDRRALLVALAQEGKITLLDHDKQPIDAQHFWWDVSRHPDDQVFVAPSDLEALIDGLLDAPRRAEEARRQAEEARRQAEETRRQAERQRRADELRRLRSIPPDARRLIRRTPKLDRKAVAMLLDSGLSAGAIRDAVALLGRELPSSFDRVVDDWTIRRAKRLYKESGFVPPGMGKFAASLTSEQRSRQRRKANADKITEWASQRPRTTEELRAHLEEFLALDVPRLGRRQQIVAERLERLKQQKTTPPTEEQRQKAMDNRRRKTMRQQPNEADMARRAAANSEDAKALEYANWYHCHVQSLYRSQYSEVSYGRGGEDEIRWFCRRYPTKYKKAGVRLDYGRKLLVIEDYRGKVVAEVPIFLMNGKLVGIGHRKYVLLPNHAMIATRIARKDHEGQP